jgi:hypothetical protein
MLARLSSQNRSPKLQSPKTANTVILNLFQDISNPSAARNRNSRHHPIAGTNRRSGRQTLQMGEVDPEINSGRQFPGERQFTAVGFHIWSEHPQQSQITANKKGRFQMEPAFRIS